MHILVTGGTGFIGRALCRALVAKGYRVSVYSRRPQKVPQLCGPGVEAIAELTPANLKGPVDGIINLAGEPIADRRWSPSRKQKLRDSRILVTQQLVRLCEQLSPRPSCLISASAVGYYGDQGDREVVESTPRQDEFSHQLCQEWEQTAAIAESLGVRVCLVRTGLVVGPGGGFLKRMLPAYRFGLGGRLGNGQQWMPWIHLADILGIYIYLLEHGELRGAFNATAPNPVRNRDFNQQLGEALHRPTFMTVPGLALKLALGELSRLLLTGQKALPQRLLKETDYRFQYPTLRQALEETVK